MTIGPVSLRHRNTFNLGVEEMKVDHHSDVIVFPQVKDVESLPRAERQDVHRRDHPAHPGARSEFYSL